MELRQLRYFVKSAETLSFSEAARNLNIAQSTLSQQVHQLEEELDTRLFERQAHSISLTESGAAMLPFAIRTINEADSCVAKVRDLKDLVTGELNIGVTYSFGPILSESLVEFSRLYPHVKLNIFYKPMAELMDMLKARSVDFVLAFRPTRRIDEIESHVLFDNHLAVIVSESHPLTAMRRVRLSDLRDCHLALPARGLQARNALEHCLSLCPERLDIRIELNDVNILFELVRSSRMVTVLAEATVYNSHGIKAIALDVPGNEMEGCVHMLKDCYRKRSALRFIDLLRNSEAVRARGCNWFL